MSATPWIPLFPTLWPSMMRPAATTALPFPWTQPNRRDFTFARYGIFAIAEALALRGREVLFPAFFHCVELDALVAAGASVRFYALGSQLQIDAESLARSIGPKTAAVYVIHYAGFPAQVRELRDLCQDAGLALIEDCAHALLSSADGEPLGSFGEAAVFSLPKSLPTPDGGVALLRNGWPDDSQKRNRPKPAWVAAHTASLLLSNLEMRNIPGSAQVRTMGLRMGKAAFSASGSDYVPMGTPNFDLAQADTTISPLSRRILQTQDFGAIVQARRRNYQSLHERLDGAVTPMFAELPSGVCPLFYPFRVDQRDRLFQGLRRRGVAMGEFWPDLHPLGPNGQFPTVNAVRRTALWLPCHQDLTGEALEWLAAAVRETVATVRA